MHIDPDEDFISEEKCEDCGELTSAWEMYSPLGCQVSFLLCPNCISANLKLDEEENSIEEE